MGDTYTLLDIYDDSIEDPIIMFRECIINTDEIYNEASDGMNKDNIFSRIWKFIKKIFKFIAKSFGRFTKWVKNLFQKKTKSADQIAEEIGVEKKTAKTNKGISDEELEEVVKNLSVQFHNDQSFTISSRMAVIDNQFYANMARVKGHPKAYDRHIMEALHHIKHPEILKNWFNFFNKILIEKSKLKSSEIISLHNQFDKIKFDPTYSDSYNITYQELYDFQVLVNSMNELLEKFDDLDNKASGISAYTVGDLNELSQVGLKLQIGLNGISMVLQNVYKINNSYWGSINDLTILSKFVKECIDSSIPVKYIINNIYNIADESVKGHHANPDHPIVGQSRVVLFPDDKDYVYKVAISKLGIRANKNECNVSEKLTGTEVDQDIAKILKTYDYIINEMEKYNNYRPTDKEKEDFIEKMSDFFFNNKHAFEIADINHGGFGKRPDGQLVLFDYGFLDRIPVSI